MADFYLGGPYHDGTYSICEVATGRVRHVFNPATDDHHVEGDKYNSRGVNTRSGTATGTWPAPNRSTLQRWAELCEKGHGQTVASEIQHHLDGVRAADGSRTE